MAQSPGLWRPNLPEFSVKSERYHLQMLTTNFIGLDYIRVWYKPLHRYWSYVDFQDKNRKNELELSNLGSSGYCRSSHEECVVRESLRRDVTDGHAVAHRQAGT